MTISLLAPVRLAYPAVSGRTEETQAAYDSQRARFRGVCMFCDHDSVEAHTIGDRGDMLVMRNRFPYATWESRLVEDHLMVVPARHVRSLGEFTAQEARDFLALTTRFEAEGYSIYTRAPANLGRSVEHAHTHLIRTGDMVA